MDTIGDWWSSIKCSSGPHWSPYATQRCLVSNSEPPLVGQATPQYRNGWWYMPSVYAWAHYSSLPVEVSWWDTGNNHCVHRSRAILYTTRLLEESLSPLDRKYTDTKSMPGRSQRVSIDTPGWAGWAIISRPADKLTHEKFSGLPWNGGMLSPPSPSPHYFVLCRKQFTHWRRRLLWQLGCLERRISRK